MINFIVKKIYCIHEIIFRRPTMSFVSHLEKSQWLSSSELKTLQQSKLRKLLSYAYEFVPFYHKAFNRLGLKPEDKAITDGLLKLPLMDKESIRENFENLRTREQIPLILSNTGGSSGNPLIFYLDKNRQAGEKAQRIRAHRWWNVDLGEKEIYIWGAPIELSKQDWLKSLRDALINEKLLSAFNMTPTSMSRYLKIIRSFRPSSIFGYPSSIALLCEHARSTGVRLSDVGIKVVFCTGEVLYDHHKQLISQTIGVLVANGYGCRDGGFIAHECPEGNLHLAAEHIIVEILDDNGNQVPMGEIGNIVITNLDGYGMPFIRYNTEDQGALSDEQCSCGRSLPLIKVIQGRTTDFILTEDGGRMHALGLIYVLREMPGICQFQIIQEDLHKVKVLIVKNGEFPHSGGEHIQSEFVKRIGPNTSVIVRFVDRIPPSKSGKYRYVISKVSLNLTST